VSAAFAPLPVIATATLPALEGADQAQSDDAERQTCIPVDGSGSQCSLCLHAGAAALLVENLTHELLDLTTGLESGELAQIARDPDA
jgi:hypothetical protein